jgi:hypothetical protein
MEDEHHYCAPCDRIFASASNLQAHLNGSAHAPKTVRCPRCPATFVSASAMTLHLEVGACPSGVTKTHVDAFIRQVDRTNFITNPSRMIESGTSTYATERSWNGYNYEWYVLLLHSWISQRVRRSYICHKTTRTLAALNQHLSSPVHQAKIYRCPKSDCGFESSALSALGQHIVGLLQDSCAC